MNPMERLYYELFLKAAGERRAVAREELTREQREVLEAQVFSFMKVVEAKEEELAAKFWETR